MQNDNQNATEQIQSESEIELLPFDSSGITEMPQYRSYLQSNSSRTVPRTTSLYQQRVVDHDLQASTVLTPMPSDTSSHKTMDIDDIPSQTNFSTHSIPPVDLDELLH